MALNEKAVRQAARDCVDRLREYIDRAVLVEPTSSGPQVVLMDQFGVWETVSEKYRYNVFAFVIVSDEQDDLPRELFAFLRQKMLWERSR